MFIKNLQLLFHPDGPGAGSGDNSISEEAQDLAQLEDITEEDDKEAETDDEVGESDEEIIEEADDDEEEGQEKEDQEDEGEEKSKRAVDESDRDETGRLTVKAIKSIKDGKYAELFKDIPELKAAFFQLPKYQEVFSDPDMAKEAKGKADEYDVLENTLVNQQNPEFLLKTIGNNAPKALVKLMRAFPEALQKLEHEEAYRALANPIIEDLLYHAAQYGNRTQDKNLQLAARHLANFMWANGGDVPDISKRSAEKAPSEAEKTLEQERSQRRREKFQEAVSSIGVDCATSVTSILSNKLGELTPFERKMLVKEARAELDMALQKDAALQGTLKTLWTKARDDGYSQQSKERIKNAWLSRAKAVAPGIRNRLKEEAVGSRTTNGDTKQEDQRKRSFISKGGLGSKNASSRVLDPAKIDWRKTSDEDILGDGSKVRLKK